MIEFLNKTRFTCVNAEKSFAIKSRFHGKYKMTLSSNLSGHISV